MVAPSPSLVTTSDAVQHLATVELPTDWTAPECIRCGLTIIGIIVAIISVLSVRSTAKKKQTADFLFSLRSDNRLIEGTRDLRELHYSTDKNMRNLVDSESSEGSDCAEKIENVRYVLNHYERLSVCLQSGIYDEDMLKKSQCNIILKTFKQAKPFIEGVREKRSIPTAYQEFEWLAERWEKAPLTKRKS